MTRPPPTPLTTLASPTRLAWVAALLVALVAALLVHPAGAAAGDDVEDGLVGTDNGSPLIEGFDADGGPDGEVEVVVLFDADVPSREAVGPSADRARKRGVRQARAGVEGRLTELGVGIDRAYDHSAFVAVTITADQLDDLAAIPGVTGVVPNGRLERMLDAATALVDAAPATVGGRTFTGDGRAVAVLDTGVDAAHPFFARPGGGHRIVAEACFAEAKDCPNGSVGPGSGAPLLVGGSPDSHGTHVAGIAAGWRNGTNPAHGMAPKADIISVQVFSTDANDPDRDPFAWWSDIAAGLEWIYSQRNNHDIAAVNLSLGGEAYAASCDGAPGAGFLRSPVDALRSAGIVTVAAAGNGGFRDRVSIPACLSNVVAVGASTNSDTIAGFSNVGTEVDLVAPGAPIRSSVVGGGYEPWDGTSMATPMVTGAIALVGEAAPGLPVDQMVGAITTSRTTIDDKRVGGTVTGMPRLDATAALSSVLGQTRPAAPSISVALKELDATVSWKAVASPNGGDMTYRVHRGGGSCSANSPVVGRTSRTSYTDRGLTHGTTYRYCAFAQEGANNVSDRSNVRAITANDSTAPSAPSLTARVSNLDVALSWTRVSDPTGPITYRLYRSTGSSCSTSSTRIRTTTGASFTDTGLDADRTYRYCMTATDGAGNTSARSNIRTVTTVDPLAGCTALSGDWNRSGRSGIGWWCDGKTKLRTASGKVITYTYGREGDVPVVADWNGDGRDTVSVIRDGTWHVNNQLAGGASARTFYYGRVTRGDIPIAGDWNRGGVDLPGIVRDREWHLRAEQSGGNADWSFIYGRLTRGDLPLWGDWNRDGRDTVGIVRDGRWHLRNVHAGGPSDISFVYGRVLAGDLPVVGDWTGDGIDTPGIVREGTWHLRNRNAGGAADRTITFPAP
jgi:subtilisin